MIELQTQKVLIFDTHPIQYRTPVFRALHQSLPGLKVYFLNSSFNGGRWWFHETGKSAKPVLPCSLTEGFPNETLDTERLGLRRALAQLRKILEDERPSAVLIYGYYLPDHWMIRRLTARLGIPLLFIGETFASTNSLLRRIVRYPLRKYFFRGVSRFIAVGDRTAEFYRSLGIPPKKIDQARYCADISFFEPPKENAAQRRSDWRRSHSIEEDAFVLLFVGRLFERKRPLDAILLHQLLQDRTSLHTVVVGSGPLEPAAHAAAQGLARIQFLGQQSQEQLKAIYPSADLLIVPSQYETWGLVVNEAFAAGIPALVTNTCGVANDLVVHGKTGFLYPVGRLTEAAKLVGSLIEDRTLHRQLAEGAGRKVRAEYQVEQFAEVLGKSFVEAAESGRQQLQHHRRFSLSRLFA